MDRKLKALSQFLGKFRYFLRLRSFFPAHAQRITEHNLPYLIFADDPLQPAKIRALVLALQGLQALRGDSQSVSHCQTHAPRAVVDGEDAGKRFHIAIIRSSRLEVSSP